MTSRYAATLGRTYPAFSASVLLFYFPSDVLVKFAEWYDFFDFTEFTFESDVVDLV